MASDWEAAEGEAQDRQVGTRITSAAAMPLRFLAPSPRVVSSLVCLLARLGGGGAAAVDEAGTTGTSKVTFSSSKRCLSFSHPTTHHHHHIPSSISLLGADVVEGVLPVARFFLGYDPPRSIVFSFWPYS
tara:strand:- start:38285 stop:38674 length:390 start_codon:yes stop_codon:yes gene_type:complete